MGEGFGHGFGFGGGVWMVLFWLIPVLLVVWGLTAFRGGSHGRGDGSAKSARELLDEEYAKGRIDREEYLRRKQDLSE